MKLTLKAVVLTALAVVACHAQPSNLPTTGFTAVTQSITQWYSGKSGPYKKSGILVMLHSDEPTTVACVVTVFYRLKGGSSGTATSIAMRNNSGYAAAFFWVGEVSESSVSAMEITGIGRQLYTAASAPDPD